MVVRRHYSMSAFHSSAHRSPVAVFRFHTQRQFTVRSCDLGQWSRSELEAQVSVGVRVMWDGTEHWLVAKDVCALIGKRVGSVGRAIFNFTEQEKARMIVEQRQQQLPVVDAASDAMRADPQSGGGSAGRPVVQVMSVLSERGVRRLLSRTRHDRAREVQQFVSQALSTLRQQHTAATRTAGGTETTTDTAGQNSKRVRNKRRNETGGEQHTALQPQQTRMKSSGSEDAQQHTTRHRSAAAADSGSGRSSSSSSGIGATSSPLGRSRVSRAVGLPVSCAPMSLPPLHSARSSAFSRTGSWWQPRTDSRGLDSRSGCSGSSQSHSAVPRPAAAWPGTTREPALFTPIVLQHSPAAPCSTNGTMLGCL